MDLRPTRRHLLALTGALALVTATVALSGGTASAVSCPTVNPVTHVVTPAPTQGVNWSGCNLSAANLSGANLSSVDLSSSNLTSAVLSSATLTDTKLTGATLDHVTSGGLVGTPATLPTSWIIQKGYLIGPTANLGGANLGGVNLANRDLNHANLAGANLTAAGLMGTNLDHALIGNANFAGAFATGAILTGASGTGGEYSGADFTAANLMGASITGATFARTNFTNATLVETNLTNDALRQATFTNARLTRSNLEGADLSEATLTSVVSGEITGTPVALPTGWTLTDGTLIAPGLLRVTSSPAVPTQVTVDGAIANSWGLSWVQRTPGSHQVCFTAVPGYTTPPCQTATMSQYATTNVTGTFVQRGYLHVTTSPAVGAQIKVDGIPRNDWGVFTDLPTGIHQVCFGAVAGFTPPPCQNVNLTAGATTNVTGTFTSSAAAGLTGVGFLRVTTYPALPSQITVDGNIADTWGLNWLQISPGTHAICFSHIEGYTEPACQNVPVVSGATSQLIGSFTPRVWIKVVTNPAVGATISINGAPTDAWGVFTDVAQGQYQVCFGDVPGFTSPACITNGIGANQIGTYRGDYLAW